jgi:hypothetical protein
MVHHSDFSRYEGHIRLETGQFLLILDFKDLYFETSWVLPSLNFEDLVLETSRVLPILDFQVSILEIGLVLPILDFKDLCLVHHSNFSRYEGQI